MNPLQTDRCESQPRLSQSGVGAGLAVASVSLAVSATAVRPTVIPDDPEFLVSFATWWVAAGLTSWLALSLVVWMMVLGRPARSARPPVAWVRRLTIPGSRQLAEAMLAVSVIALPSACSTGATQVAPPRIEVLSSGEDGQQVEVLADSTIPSSTVGGDSSDSGPGFSAGVGTLSDSAAALGTGSAAPLAPGRATGGQDDGLEDEGLLSEPVEAAQPDGFHVVVRGDNFWAIADAHLSAVTGNSPSNSQIASYWRELVNANRHVIVSGNPDLIYPGEQLALPSVLTE